MLLGNAGRWIAEQDRIYLNDGRGRFTEVPFLSDAWPAWQVLAGDVDGDLRTHLYTQDTVTLGGPFSINLWADEGQYMFPAISLGRLDTRIPGLGTLILDPAQAILLPPRLMSASRRDSVTLQMPSDPTLRGRTIYTQALQVDGANPGRRLLTGWVEDKIQ